MGALAGNLIEAALSNIKSLHWNFQIKMPEIKRKLINFIFINLVYHQRPGSFNNVTTRKQPFNSNISNRFILWHSNDEGIWMMLVYLMFPYFIIEGWKSNVIEIEMTQQFVISTALCSIIYDKTQQYFLCLVLSFTQRKIWRLLWINRSRDCWCQ